MRENRCMGFSMETQSLTLFLTCILERSEPSQTQGNLISL